MQLLSGWAKPVLAAVFVVGVAGIFYLREDVKGRSHVKASRSWRGICAAFLRWLLRKLQRDTDQLAEIAMNFSASQVAYTLAVHGVADALEAGPKTLPALAEAVEADPGRLYRLLRAAIALGLFSEAPSSSQGAPAFCNNSLSRLMLEGHPSGMRFLLMHLMEDCWTAWGHLHDGIDTPYALPFDRAHGGESFWSYLKNHPAQRKVFARAMTALNSFGMSEVMQGHDWLQYTKIIDLHGDSGTFLATILAARGHEGQKGILVQPSVLAGEGQEVSARLAASHGVSDRMSFTTGDLHQPGVVPACSGPGEAYVLRCILHAQPDMDALPVLKRVHEAMGEQRAYLVLIERCLPPGISQATSQQALSDLHVMVLANGRERNLEEWRSLLQSASFKLIYCHAMQNSLAIMVAMRG
ncbi:hypothetical protein WJX84_004740 [Apatococcus fuscideae]|uniref:O-methyltransferase domain-containing protein n=1 Tax=Apatococcus fuscideae TaxID=2026836 RepID=A0AAW1T6F0_9CHLO